MVPEILKMRHWRVEELRWESLNIYTLVLMPLTEDDQFTFKAGQWVYLHLLNPDGSSWKRAAFSVATAPSESQDLIELAIKVHGPLTTRGKDLQPDDRVDLQGPFGVFTMPPQGEPVVLFAGGIGIAPLRSMIREMAFQNDPRQVILFYSNRDHEDTAFYEDFDDLSERMPNFTAVFTLTGDQIPAKWEHGRGRFTKEDIQKHVPDLADASFFCCGPDGFMEAIQQQLTELGVDLKKQYHQESFGS